MNKAKKPKLNVKLLRKIQKHILEEPRRLVMRHVSITRLPDESSFLGDKWQSQKFAPCGTAACIAGWAMLLSGVKPYDARTGVGESTDRAGDLLRLSGPKQDSLFFEDEWPQPFAQRYASAKTPNGRAKTAAARIEHLIKTGE